MANHSGDLHPMLRDYGLLVFAAAIALAFVSFGIGAMIVSPTAHEQPNQSYRFASDKPEEITPAPPQSARNDQPSDYRTPCRDPKGQGESDLCAQWRAANAAEDSALWAMWGFLITVVGSSLLLWQIFLTREAVQDTAKATDAMVEANHITRHAERAFLYLIPNLTRRGANIEISVTNNGRTPANILGCFVREYASLPLAKAGFDQLTGFELSMDMVVGPVGETTVVTSVPEPDGPAIRIEVLYMDIFGGKRRTTGFYEARDQEWVLRNNTGWIDMI